MRFDPGSIGLGRDAHARGRVLDAALGGVERGPQLGGVRGGGVRAPPVRGERREEASLGELRRAQLPRHPDEPLRVRVGVLRGTALLFALLRIRIPSDELRHHLGFEVPLEVSHGVSSVGGPLELLRGGGGGLLGGGGVRLRHPRASRRGVRARRLRLGESPRRLRLRLGGDGVPRRGGERRLEALRALPRELMALLRARVRDDAAPREALLRGHRGGARLLPRGGARVERRLGGGGAAERRRLPRRRAPRLRRRATDLALSLEDELTKTVNHRGGPPRLVLPLARHRRERRAVRRAESRLPAAEAAAAAAARERARAAADVFLPRGRRPARAPPRRLHHLGQSPLDARPHARRVPRRREEEVLGGVRVRDERRQRTGHFLHPSLLARRRRGSGSVVERGPPEDHGGAPGVCGDGVDAFFGRGSLRRHLFEVARVLRLERLPRGLFARLRGAPGLGGGVAPPRERREVLLPRRRLGSRVGGVGAIALLPRAQFAQPRLRARRRPERRGEVRFRPRRAVSARGGLRGELRAPPLQRRLGGLRRCRLGGERDDVLFAIARPRVGAQRIHRLGEDAELRGALLEQGLRAARLPLRRLRLRLRLALLRSRRALRELRVAPRLLARGESPRALRPRLPRVLGVVLGGGFRVRRLPLRRRAPTRRLGDLVRPRRGRALLTERGALARVVKRAIALGDAVQGGGQLARRVDARRRLAAALERRALHLATKALDLRAVPRRVPVRLRRRPGGVRAEIAGRERARVRNRRREVVRRACGFANRLGADAARRLRPTLGKFRLLPRPRARRFLRRRRRRLFFFSRRRTRAVVFRVAEVQERVPELLLRDLEVAAVSRLGEADPPELLPEPRHLRVESAPTPEARHRLLQRARPRAPVRLRRAELPLQPLHLVLVPRRRLLVLQRLRRKAAPRVGALGAAVRRHRVGARLRQLASELVHARR